MVKSWRSFKNRGKAWIDTHFSGPNLAQSSFLPFVSVSAKVSANEAKLASKESCVQFLPRNLRTTTEMDLWFYQKNGKSSSIKEAHTSLINANVYE